MSCFPIVNNTVQKGANNRVNVRKVFLYIYELILIMHFISNTVFVNVYNYELYFLVEYLFSALLS